MRNFIILLGILLIFATGYWVFKNSERFGFDFSSPEIQDKPIDLAIRKYITSKIVYDIYPQSKVFCSYHTYGTEKDEEHNYTYAYLWVFCEEYYIEGNQPVLGQGVSYPVKLIVEEEDGKFTVQSHEEPEDGENYAKSIRNMFPDKFEDAAINGYKTERFNPNPLDQAKMYFSLN